MTAAGEALAAAAEALVGSPFRLHGRDPATGLDCVGLVAAALERCGRRVSPPSGYRLRRLDLTRLLGAAESNGFVATDALQAPGDLLLVRPGPAQWHLAVAGRSGGFIEAHAGLGRVVLTPAPLSAPVVRRWRLTG